MGLVFAYRFTQNWRLIVIFYVEDDTNIRDLVVYTLGHSVMETKGFQDGVAFKSAITNAISSTLPSLILLDVMLPGEDGIALLNWLKKDPAVKEYCENIPVIMITAKTSEYDTILGLDLGADDYIKKPFSMMELISRVKAVLRRSASNKAVTSTKEDNTNTEVAAPVSNKNIPINKIISQGPIEIDCAKHVAYIVLPIEGDCEKVNKKESIPLTLKEYDLLSLLVENCGITFERDRLLETVWGYGYVGETRTVDVHVRTLRQKLGEFGIQYENLIETVRGVGYKFQELE